MTMASMNLADTPMPSAAAVTAVRQFNRFYTREIGALDPYLGGPMPLTEVRVLYELAHRPQTVASELARELGLDGGYLSRILRRFETQGWISRTPHAADGRQSVLVLTQAGHDAFAPLQQRSRDEATALLSRLSAPDQQRLIHAMQTVQTLLATEQPGSSAQPRTVVLRDPQPGDIGWV